MPIWRVKKFFAATMRQNPQRLNLLLPRHAARHHVKRSLAHLFGAFALIGLACLFGFSIEASSAPAFAMALIASVCALFSLPFVLGALHALHALAYALLVYRATHTSQLPADLQRALEMLQRIPVSMRNADRRGAIALIYPMLRREGVKVDVFQVGCLTGFWQDYVFECDGHILNATGARFLDPDLSENPIGMSALEMSAFSIEGVRMPRDFHLSIPPSPESEAMRALLQAQVLERDFEAPLAPSRSRRL